jgi:hypothetical protein
MLGAIAEFERGLLLERQREGVARRSGREVQWPSTNGTRQGRRCEILKAAHPNRTAHWDRRSVSVSRPGRRQEAGCRSSDTGVR